MPVPSTLNFEKLSLAIGGKPLGLLERMAVEAMRAKVPGGWLVLVSGTEGTSGVTFYPDPKHEWDGGSLDRP